MLQVCDMIKNSGVYARMGAKLPQGILLFGKPGLGKTLMAKCFIQESGLNALVVRRDKGNDDFIANITKTFAQAKEQAPIIVFLDDMDKFANEDTHHRDAEEYVAVQAGIDEVKNCGVFVLATANDVYKLPDSLIRSGRFDRRIEIHSPSHEDARAIVQHYLGDKRVSDQVNMEDLTKMISYSSCAELETILNEAAILAAFARKDHIEMADLTRAVLREQYDSPDNFAKAPGDILRKIALHEAGHLVVSEALCPGSVGLASLRSTGRDSTGGFIHHCQDLPRRPHCVLISLAGKAAVELYYSASYASGCYDDIRQAFNYIREGLSMSGSHGLGLVDVETRRSPAMSESLNARSEAVIQAEMEQYLFQARDILLKNRDFLEQTTAALLGKETLLYSDIKALRKRATVSEHAA